MAKASCINPLVLKWARTTSRLGLEEVAKKIGTDVATIESWEAGADVPTYAKLKELSKAYRRPLGIFWLPEVPKFTPLRDFRRIESNGEYSSTLAFMIRRTQEVQQMAKDLLLESGAKPLSFVGSASVSEDPFKVASRIIKALGISRHRDMLQHWIQSAEQAGIFVSRASHLHSKATLPAKEVRGFALCDDIAPFIFINTDDSPTAQLFTAVHELAHIWINSSGVSGELERDDLEREERFCNQVAAEALMPMDFLRQSFDELPSFERLKTAAFRLQVSPHALAFRIYKAGMIGLEAYRSLREDIQGMYDEAERRKAMEAPKPSDGGPNPNLLTVNRNSKKFTTLVYNTYADGRIDSIEASRMLSLKLKAFEQVLSWIKPNQQTPMP